MELRLDLVLPTEAAGVPVVRRLLHGCLQSLDVDPDTAADVELALSEACTNVVRHARGAEPYTVTAVITAGRCELRVADHGSGFPPTALACAAGPEAESGRGLPLMRSLLDELRFTPAPGGGTVAWLTKYLCCCPVPGPGPRRDGRDHRFSAGPAGTAARSPWPYGRGARDVEPSAPPEAMSSLRAPVLRADGSGSPGRAPRHAGSTWSSARARGGGDPDDPAS